MGRVGVSVEVGRLDDRGGKIQSVLKRKIDGVHGLRSHPPFAAVDRLVELAKLVTIFEQFGALRVAERVALDDFETRVIAPPVGIAHADLQRVELLLRFDFGFRRHPGQGVDPLGERLDQIGDHGLRLRLGFRGEVALHIQLADRVSQRVIGEIDTALPPRTLLRDSAERLAIKVKTLVDERFWKEGRGLFDRVKREPVLPCIERFPGGQSGQARDGLGLPHDDDWRRRSIRRLREAPASRAPAPCWAARFDSMRLRSGRPRIPRGWRARAPWRFRARTRARRGRPDRVKPASLNMASMCARYCLRNCVHLRRCGEIVIAVGHSETALQQIGVSVGWVGEALGDPDSEEVSGLEIGVVERVDVGAQLSAQRAGQSWRSAMAAMASS